MKQKETKILIALIAIILILGTIMIATKGIAFELKYQDSQKVELKVYTKILTVLDSPVHNSHIWI